MINSTYSTSRQWVAATLRLQHDWRPTPDEVRRLRLAAEHDTKYGTPAVRRLAYLFVFVFNATRDRRWF